MQAEWGTCRPYPYTATGDGFGGVELYFNENNQIVATTSWTDVIEDSRCPGWKHYGEPTTCKRVPVEKLR